MYEGAFKTRDQIALLVQDEYQKVHLEKMNGEEIRNDMGIVYELMPGHYSFCFRLVYSKADTLYSSKTCQTIELTVLAGHTYEFYAAEEHSTESWIPLVRDITEDLRTPEMKTKAEKIDALVRNAREK